MGHKCFISFKEEDELYKNKIKELRQYDGEMIDRSLDATIDSQDVNYVMRKIRQDHLSDSTVTIFLIGQYSAEIRGYSQQQFIKRELQASLYNGDGNTRNGILGVVLPTMSEAIFRGSYQCGICGHQHNNVVIDDSTVIKEFSMNYYIANPPGYCYWTEDDRYCVLASWEDFINNPYYYIEKAFNKRDEKISEKVTVYPKE